MLWTLPSRRQTAAKTKTRRRQTRAAQTQARAPRRRQTAPAGRRPQKAIPPEQRTTAENKTLTCTVMIECTDILRHMDELDKSAARHLPDDGVLLQSVQISVKSGASVYDAVEAACKKGGVAINAQKSIYGTYIAGFGGINEKCCGSDSGWLYFVNGESPSLASSACKVKNGDKIEFRFACDPPDAANYSN